MSKRIFGILLALLMLISLMSFAVGAEEATQESTEATTEATAEEPTEAPAEAPTEEEETGLTISDDCMVILKKEEGFSFKPYWDYSQYTVGYGTQCPEDMRAYYTANGITEQEAEDLLRNHLAKVEDDLNAFAEKYGLTWTQNQFDAILLFSYNCGTGWCYDSSGAFHQGMANSVTDNELIRCFALWCSAGGEIQSYLLRRRLSEANMYLNGVYSQTPPDNYCYVLYDACGGVSKPRSQGYNSDWPVAPFPVPTYEGYIFDGWYTAKIGGEKVTELNAATKGKTFYAHWIDDEGNQLDTTEPTVVVEVTGSSVNMRKGPGTNYTSIGRTAQKGEQLTIVETASGSPSRWGRFTEYGGGWICLQYTNYDSALEDLKNSDTTEPDPTEPTEPETTEPTEPETTEPTEPPVEETKKVMGTVKVNEFLRVRSGPSTGYTEVTRLKPNDRVEILEQKVVGATVWGRISQGWISMDYVKLDATSDSSDDTASDNTDSDTTTGGDTGAAAAQSATVVNCNEWVRIRSGAGTSYDIAGYYYPGDKVSVTEQTTVGSTTWAKTDKGWVSMYYLKLDTTSGGTTTGGTTSGGTTSGETAATTGKIVNCNEWVRIRSGAGTSYSIAGYYYPGDTVTVIEQKTVGATTWAKTDKGWVSMAYVELQTAASGGTEEAKVMKTITADCLNVRNNPGTSGTTVVGYLYYGTQVEILETTSVGGTQWGRISTGWISLDYTK